MWHRHTNQVDSITRGERDDVGAGDGGLAGRFHLRLDGVDHLVPTDGLEVGAGVLLPGEGRRVVQEDRAVAPLACGMTTNRLKHID